jgi:hypothetical protein
MKGVQRNAAGSSRVSLESPVILSPKNGGSKGVEDANPGAATGRLNVTEY